MVRIRMVSYMLALVFLVSQAVIADEFSLRPVYLQDAPAAEPIPEPPAQRTTLNEALSNWGPTRDLIDSGFDFGGWIEGSYTLDVTAPDSDLITGRVFDSDNNQVLGNQLMLYAQRALTPTSEKFDIGFRVEMMYGTDARYIHSNGLNWYGSGTADFTPQYQLDLTQGYATFNVPIGNGVIVTAGKFVTLFGAETINPLTNPLYSHSYLFDFAIPFTQTGVLGAYSFNENLTVTAGITRGWDQSVDDNNGAIDGLGQIKWLATDQLTVIVTGTIGPELPGNNSLYQGLIDVIVTYAMSDQLSFTLNGDWGGGPGVAANGEAGDWFGVAGYVGCKLDSRFTLNGRIEFFNDDDGARGLGTTVYEATAGVTITPFPDHSVFSTLKIRPECRVDWADDPIFNSGEDSSQVTVAIDALFSF